MKNFKKNHVKIIYKIILQRVKSENEIMSYNVQKPSWANFLIFEEMI